MANFHHHPDGWVYVRTDAGVYVDTPENFAADLGQPYNFDGRERYYEPGARHFVDHEPQPLDWSQGDAYIAACEALLAAQEARLNPPLSLEQLRARALDQIDRAVGSYRQQFVSAGYAMADVYQLKAEVARAWLANGEENRTAENYPLVYQELAGHQDAGVDTLTIGGQPMDVTTAAGVVATWAANDQLYTRVILPAAERARLRAKGLAASAIAEDLPVILAELADDLAAII